MVTKRKQRSDAVFEYEEDYVSLYIRSTFLKHNGGGDQFERLIGLIKVNWYRIIGKVDMGWVRGSITGYWNNWNNTEPQAIYLYRRENWLSDSEPK